MHLYCSVSLSPRDNELICVCPLQYDKVYNIWRDFCQNNNVPEFKADHKALAACLSLLMLQDGSYSKVVMLSAAIANEYRIRMLPSPTTHETISLLFRGFRNQHPQTRTAKSLITEEILDKMYSQLHQSGHGWTESICRTLENRMENFSRIPHTRQI